MTLVAVLPMTKGQFRLVVEDGRRGRGQDAGIAVADDGGGRLEEGVQGGRQPLAELQVIDGGANQLGRLGHRRPQPDAVQVNPVLAGNGRFDFGLNIVPIGNHLVNKVVRPPERHTLHRRHSIHHIAVLDYAQLVIVV